MTKLHHTARLLILRLCLFSIYSGVVAYAGTNDLPMHTVWQMQIGDPEFHYVANTLAIKPNKEGFYIAGSSMNPAQPSESGKFWLWEVDREGRLAGHQQIKNPLGESPMLPSLFAHVKDMVTTETARLYLLVEYKQNETFLVSVDETGKQVAPHKIAITNSNTSIARMIKTMDKNLYLLGQQSVDPVVIKTDLNGRVIWEKVVDIPRRHSGDPAVLVDGMATTQGGLIVVGNSAAADSFFVGPSVLSLVKLDREGKLLTSATIDGRHGKIVIRPSGGYALAYTQFERDAGQEWLQIPTVAIVDDSLKLVRVKKLDSIPQGLAEVHLVALPNEGLLLAGSRNNRLWLVRLDRELETKWEYWADNAEKQAWAWKCSSVLVEDDVYVLTSIFGSDAQARPLFKVGLLRLRP